MLINEPTLLGYSAVLFCMLGILFLIFWLRDERRSRFLWGALAFFMAVCGAAVLVDTSVLTRVWSGRIAIVCILLAHGFVWLMVRAFFDRGPRLPWVLLPPAIWLFLRMTVVEQLGLLSLSGALVVLLEASYNALCAYELWRSRAEKLPARAYLFWVFSASAGWNAARSLSMPYLPQPLGVLPGQIWATVVYNLAMVTEALLVTTFLIALSRERVALQLYRLAFADSLTGIGNRRALDQWADGWRSGRAADAALAVFVADIDHFKIVNDSFGHSLGDEVIVIAARTAQSILRAQDSVFRIGGEEFVCLLPGVEADEALAVAERLREAFRAAAHEVSGQTVSASLSIGIATAQAGERDLRDVLGRADKALYRSKQLGRDRTTVASQFPPLL